MARASRAAVQRWELRMDLPCTCVPRELMFACTSEITNSTRHGSATRRPVSQREIANVMPSMAPE